MTDGSLTIEAAPVEEYTVTFANWDGTVLQSGKVAKGEVPKYEGADPTRPKTDQYTYTFAGWTPEVVAVSGDATYTAKYTETAVQPKNKPDQRTEKPAKQSASGTSLPKTGDPSAPTRAALTAGMLLALSGWTLRCRSSK